MMTKSAVCFLLMGVFSMAQAQEITGAHLYQEMDSQQKQGLVDSLNQDDLQLNDFLVTKIKIDEPKSSISIDSAFPDAKKYKRWVVSGGLNYLFPIGPGITAEVAYQNKRGYKIVKSQFSATTTGTFSRGAVQSYEWSPQLQFGRVKAHIGPVVQLLHVYNPMLYGQTNFFYKAVGFNIGYEFQKVFRDRRWSIDLYGQTTTGGYNQDPKVFILLGGGMKISVSNKIIKRK